MSMCFLHVRRKLASLSGFARPLFAAALLPVLVLILCFFLVGMATAKPPQAPNPPQAPTYIPPCGCGCMETGQCKCKNCCERTADPTWKPSQAFAAPATAEQWVRVCGPDGCRLVKLSPAQARPVGDFLYDPPTPGPTFTPAGGCPSGACGSSGPFASGGSCGSPAGWYPGKALGRPVPRRLR